MRWTVVLIAVVLGVVAVASVPTVIGATEAANETADADNETVFVELSLAEPAGDQNVTQRARTVVDARLRALAADGYEGSVVRSDDRRLIVRMAPEPTDRVLGRLVQPGAVDLAATLPGDDRPISLLSNGDFASVRGLSEGSGTVSVPARLTDRGAERFVSTLVRLNFTSEGVGGCPGSPAPNSTGYCLVLSLDDERITAAGITEPFARAIENGDFETDPWFRLVTENRSTARDLQTALVAPPLPTEATVVDVRSEPPAEPTVSADETESGSGDERLGTDSGGVRTTTGASGSGFTALLAVCAVVAGAAAAVRRQ